MSLTPYQKNLLTAALVGVGVYLFVKREAIAAAESVGETAREAGSLFDITDKGNFINRAVVGVGKVFTGDESDDTVYDWFTDGDG